ncbi:MAG: universal stress protein [Gammaproteobacteria bacterium]|nr:universal stress protein [Gammaproteobacteria bacterium]
MKRFRNIIYHADVAVSHAKSLSRAVALAQSNNAALTLVDVVPRADRAFLAGKKLGLDLDILFRQHRQRELEALAEPHRDRGVSIATKTFTGHPFVDLIRVVQREGYDLLVKPPRRPEGIAERLFGSSDMHILRKCPCPVWVDRPESAQPYRNIVAAVDPVDEAGYDLSRLIMDLARSLADSESANLHVVHAWRLQGEAMLKSGRARISAAQVEELLNGAAQAHRQKLDQLLKHYGLTASSDRVNLVKERAARAITSLAEAVKADLIVIGTVGRIGVPGLIIGNTAEDVLQTTRASVLALKPSGFASPVTLA